MDTPQPRKRAPGAGRKPLVSGERRIPTQFSLSSRDLERLERFQHTEGIPNRSEALRKLLEKAGF